MLCNEDGKSRIRARERILYSPIRPIVTDPKSDILLVIRKTVGILEKPANCKINVNKSFFYAGEMAYIRVKIDNKKCSNACSLIVSHMHHLKIMLEDRQVSNRYENTTQKYFLAHANSEAEVVLQF